MLISHHGCYFSNMKFNHLIISTLLCVFFVLISFYVNDNYSAFARTSDDQKKLSEKGERILKGIDNNAVEIFEGVIINDLNVKMKFKDLDLENSKIDKELKFLPKNIKAKSDKKFLGFTTSDRKTAKGLIEYYVENDKDPDRKIAFGYILKPNKKPDCFIKNEDFKSEIKGECIVGHDPDRKQIRYKFENFP